MRFSYTGQIWLNELGLYHYKARAYSPTLGRFLQTDPIGYEDQFNLYAYVGNDPANSIDPTGMATCGSNLSGADCARATDAAEMARAQNLETAEALRGMAGIGVGKLSSEQAKLRDEFIAMFGSGSANRSGYERVARNLEERAETIGLTGEGMTLVRGPAKGNVIADYDKKKNQATLRPRFFKLPLVSSNSHTMAAVLAHEAGHKRLKDLPLHHSTGLGINGKAYGVSASHYLVIEGKGRQFKNNDNYTCVAFFAQCQD